MNLGTARSVASVLAVALGGGLATCWPCREVSTPPPGSLETDVEGRPQTSTSAGAPESPQGPERRARSPILEGPAAGLYSEGQAWLDDQDPSPRLLLYFQGGTQGGVKVYSKDQDDPDRPQAWLDERRGDAVEGDLALWYRHPPLGADAPDEDALNASSRLLWRTFGRPVDVSSHRYLNVWVKPLDGYEGVLGVSLGSWDPALGGSSGDDGRLESHLFPQRISGAGWQCLSIDLAQFTRFDPAQFAKYVLDFPSSADGHAFLIDDLSFSANAPPAAGPPDPEVYALAEPGRDPTSAADHIEVRFDRTRRYQTVRGFGFFGDASAKERLILDLGATLVRFEIPAGDPPEGQAAARGTTLGWEPVNDDADDDSFIASLDGFDQADVDGLIDAMRAYRALDPSIGFFACPWSPPAWMKNGGRVTGGASLGDRGNALRDDAFGEYGEYLAAFALHLHREGVSLTGLSLGNEVHFNHDFASMNLVGPDLRRGIRETASRLRRAEARIDGFEAPLLTAADHVLNDFFYERDFVPMLEGLARDPEAAGAVKVISYHSYGVDAQTPENVSGTVLARLRTQVDAALGSEVELWMTETSGFGNHLLDDGDRRGALRMAEGLHTSLVYAEVAAWVYFAADELLHYGQLSWPGHVLRHYARFVRPGAVRFEAAPSARADRVLVSAYERSADHAEGPAITVVLINLDDVPHGLDLSGLPLLPGGSTYREVRSSRHHLGEDLGVLVPADSANAARTPYVLPPHAIVTLVHEPASPDPR